ncbi:hypothetical protein BDV34DRAFT_219142 [Aspergillus parasiticus]|uniref:Uncharacterized protein n=1 Tax=Aspergillus parasiticus TaxID=5067 RepID=A0A5N6E441_ASPPA|nr:hypothetical protein BDV34DRAFT_219142 [Aspergillus parasiticus]
MARSGYSQTDSINESFESIMNKLEGELNLPKYDLESTPPWSLDYNVPAWAILYNRSLPVPKDTIHIYPSYTVEPGIMVEFTTELDGVYELALVPSGTQDPEQNICLQKQQIASGKVYKAFWGMAQHIAQLERLQSISILVRHLSSASTPDRKPSSWVPSTRELRVSRCPSMTPVTALKIGEDVFVEWADVREQCRVIDHYFVATMDRNGTIAPYHGQDAAQPDGRQCVKLTSPPLITHDSHNELRVLISPQPMSEHEEPFLLPRQFHVNIDQGYMLNIDNGSYFDMGNYQAVLYVNIEGASLSQDKEYSVIIRSLTRTNHELESEPLPISINWGYAIQVIWSAVATIPHSCISQSSKLSGVPFALQVTLVDPSRNNYRISQPSRPWFLPQIIGPLDLPCIKSTSHFDGGVSFSWSDIQSPDISSPNALILYPVREGRAERVLENLDRVPRFNASKDQVSCTADRLASYIDSGILRMCFRVATGKPPYIIGRRYYLSVPVPTSREPGKKLWLARDWSILFHSGLVPVPNETPSNPCFLAMTSRNAIKKVWSEPVSMKSISVAIPNDEPINAFGGALAACSRPGSQHSEFFYIAKNGSIQGRRRIGDSGLDDRWIRPSDYPFSFPGTASTLAGGSLTAIAHRDAMELYWVAPAGDIKMATWEADRGWSQSLRSIIGPQEVDVTGSEVSRYGPVFQALTTGALVRPRKTFLIWKDSEHFIKMATSPDYQPVTMLDSSFTAQKIWPSVKIATTITYYQRVAMLWVFWVTPNYAVHGAFKSATSTSPQDTWTVFPVTGPNCADASTPLKIVPSGNPEEDNLVLLWFDRDCLLQAASPFRSHTSLHPLNLRHWYQFNVFWGISSARDRPSKMAMATAPGGRVVFTWVAPGAVLRQVVFGFNGREITH